MTHQKSSGALALTWPFCNSYRYLPWAGLCELNLCGLQEMVTGGLMRQGDGHWMLARWSRRSEDKGDAAIECDLSRAIVIIAILYEYAEVGWAQ